ncbi:hypothetical protein SAMN04489832_7202 [Micromonospora cremea]|uniref:Secreted protein n=2 Tax=Micromonospora cremea TaxID=709881 RepID=A0A1N6BDS9_9ACTN|nr:hypothetical protein SAMN04489832_7202 [Micromonospora cremea]
MRQPLARFAMRGLLLTALSLGVWAAADATAPGTAWADDRQPGVVADLLGAAGETIDALIPDRPVVDRKPDAGREPKPKPPAEQGRPEQPKLGTRPERAQLKPAVRPASGRHTKPAADTSTAPQAGPLRAVTDTVTSLTDEALPRVDRLLERVLDRPLIDRLDQVVTQPGAKLREELTPVCPSLDPILRPIVGAPVGLPTLGVVPQPTDHLSQRPTVFQPRAPLAHGTIGWARAPAPAPVHPADADVRAVVLDGDLDRAPGSGPPPPSPTAEASSGKVPPYGAATEAPVWTQQQNEALVQQVHAQTEALQKAVVTFLAEGDQEAEQILRESERIIAGNAGNAGQGSPGLRPVRRIH